MVQVQDNEEKMTPEQFVYWLQGFMEMAEPKNLSEKQVQMIKDHLAQVFTKKTPDYTISTTIQDLQPVHRTSPAFIVEEPHVAGCKCYKCSGPTAVVC